LTPSMIFPNAIAGTWRGFRVQSVSYGVESMTSKTRPKVARVDDSVCDFSFIPIALITAPARG
jgi:hypothetical protein